MSDSYIVLSIGFVFVSSLFVFSQHKMGSAFPPSNYIGGLMSYEGFRNGQLPCTNRMFTGYWKSPDDTDGVVHVEGGYVDGKPNGMWIFRDIHGRIASRFWYGSHSNFVSSSYYSDGFPRLIIRAKYVFENNQYLQPEGVEQLLRFDFFGKPLSDGPTEQNNPLGWRSYLYMDTQFVKDHQFSFECIVTVSTDGSFSLCTYLFDERGQRLITKNVVSGWLMFETNVVKIEKTVTYAQDCEISIKLDSNLATKRMDKKYFLNVQFITSRDVTFSTKVCFKEIPDPKNIPVIIKTREYGVEARP